MDAIELLADDHRHLHGLLVHWERMGAAGPERRRLLDEIVRALVTHASIEERVLHPALLDLPGGPELAEVAAREHAEAEGAVARIERLDPGDPRVDHTLQAVIPQLRKHLRREREHVLPLLPRHMTRERLLQLGRELERARRSAPTRPHPSVPRSPALKKLSDPVVSLVDRALDAAREAAWIRPEGRHRTPGP
jgi:hypothetical protein